MVKKQGGEDGERLRERLAAVRLAEERGVSDEWVPPPSRRRRKRHKRRWGKAPADERQGSGELRKARREALLPGDRRCPVCGLIKLKSRSWVVRGEGVSYPTSGRRGTTPSPSGFVALCLVCYRAGPI